MDAFGSILGSTLCGGLGSLFLHTLRKSIATGAAPSKTVQVYCEQNLFSFWCCVTAFSVCVMISFLSAVFFVAAYFLKLT